MRKKISAVVPTYNCAGNLSRCLQSISFADEIIVIDMGSTDKTVKVAESYGAKVIVNVPPDGNFDKNRKIGMERAKGDWILKLDSDEVLSPALQKEMQRLLKTDNGEYNGFNLYNRIFMFGRQIKHGFVKSNSHELRLVRNGHWHYDPYRFHQQITVGGKTGFLRGYYDHYNISSVGEFIEKMNRYTNVDAKHYTKEISATSVLLSPIKTFCKLFFWQVGFFDGRVGLVVCSLYAIYNLTEKIKIWGQQNI